MGLRRGAWAAWNSRERILWCRGWLLQEHGLNEEQRDEFEDMLRGLTLEREQVKKAMTFALDNAEAANDVSSNLSPTPVLFLPFPLHSTPLSPGCLTPRSFSMRAAC